MSTEHNSLSDALAAVMAEVGGVVTTKQHNSYGIVSTQEIKAHVQPAMAKHGVVMIQTHTEHEVVAVPDGQAVPVIVRSTFRFLWGAESVEAQGIGCGLLLSKAGGLQTEGLQHAQTRALRTALVNSLTLPISENERIIDDVREKHAANESPEDKAEREKRALLAKITSTLADAAGKAPDALRAAMRDPEARLRVATERDTDTIREALQSAKAGAWDVMAELFGVELEGAPAKEKPDAKKVATKKAATKSAKAEPEPEEETEAVCPEPEAEEDTADAEEWTLPAHTPKPGATASYKRKFWTGVLKQHPRYDEFNSTSKNSLEKMCTSSAAKDAGAAVALEALCREIAGGAEVLDALQVAKTVYAEAIK